MNDRAADNALAILRSDPAFKGDVRSDRLARALYATDASIYEIVPDGVVFPRCTGDVVRTLSACRAHGVPLTARGAGTGLTGGAVNRGIQLDCSRHLHRILDIDVANRTARVQPGVVLDDLNRALAPHGLHFAPDVATSSRATIGGMIANNSCGAHSVLVGRTVDHVRSVDVVLASGERHTWGQGAREPDHEHAKRCEAVLGQVVRDCADEIATRFPKLLRSNGGYGLDRLRVENGRATNVEAIICGSEGTLAIVVGATLRLTPLPRCRGLVVAHFNDLLESLATTPIALEHKPAAVELVDKLILTAAAKQPAMARRRAAIQGDPQAILIIELFDDDEGTLRQRLGRLAADLKSKQRGYAWPIIEDPTQQADLWELRNSGLGLLMSRPGDRQPYAFVEDTAVEPSRLPEYIRRFAEILRDEKIDQAGYYAHASVGCLHVRPVLNLGQADDVERMRRIADRVSSLALEFGGTMTAEHGDGIIRSSWLEKMYGPRIVAAFETIKRTFDPDGLLNPGKIVSPLPMTANLRRSTEGSPHGLAVWRTHDSHGSDAAPSMAPTAALDFSEHGGVFGLAKMCSGVGACRARHIGTMCPSYAATGDEMHTTRARANALRIAMSDSSLLDGLSDPALDEVMDLCLSCKACKSECPTGVDMAKLKAHWLDGRNRRRGPGLRSRLIAATAELAKLGSAMPRLANAVLQSTWARAAADRLLGLDRRVAPSMFAKQTFRDWFARRERRHTSRSDTATTPVVYSVDTWTNHFTPQVGIAAVKVLESLGHCVIVPPTVCCGRPAISRGLLDKAKRLAERNVAVLGPYAAKGTPIIGTEPSCLLTFVDEVPQLVRTPDARRVAACAMTAEQFVAKALSQQPDRLRFNKAPHGVRLHGHCHEKSLIGTDAAISILTAATQGRATQIDSGCCGMAGAFGHEVEHYDVAHAIGEERLFPAVRERGDDTIAVTGFSCRCHIEHHTDAEPRHVMEIIADALS